MQVGVGSTKVEAEEVVDLSSLSSYCTNIVKIYYEIWIVLKFFSALARIYLKSSFGHLLLHIPSKILLTPGISDVVWLLYACLLFSLPPHVHRLTLSVV
jgi:hypothetical protein